MALSLASGPSPLPRSSQRRGNPAKESRRLTGTALNEASLGNWEFHMSLALSSRLLVTTKKKKTTTKQNPEDALKKRGGTLVTTAASVTQETWHSLRPLTD